MSYNPPAFEAAVCGPKISPWSSSAVGWGCVIIVGEDDVRAERSNLNGRSGRVDSRMVAW